MARGRSTFGLERWHLRACKLWLWAGCVVTVKCPRFVSWLSRADIIAVYSAIEPPVVAAEFGQGIQNP